MTSPPDRDHMSSFDRGLADARRAERAADAVWRRLCDGVTASWLDEIRDLRTHEDDYETSLNIWTVALTVELKDPAHRGAASIILTRLRQLPEEIAMQGDRETHDTPA